MMNKLIFVLLLSTCFIYAEKPYFQQYVNYNIKAKLDIDKKAVLGRQTMFYKNNSPDTLNQIYFHLYMNKYRSDALTEDGEPRNFTSAYIHIEKIFLDSVETWDYNLEKTLMRIPLDTALIPGDSIFIQYEFKTYLPRSSGRFGYYGDHFAVANWFPTPANYDADGWHLYPHLDNEFYQEWADFYVELEVPKGFRVGATGNLINGEELNPDSLNADLYYENKADSLEYVTWKYDAPDVHDFAWVADPNFKLLTYKYDEIDINYLVMSENYQAWKDNTEFSAEAMAFFEDKFGPYPYNQITIVDSYIRAGGMEYPNIVFINTFQHPDYNLSYFRAVILHEIVHNWFYGIFATNQTEDEWLDEGFTTFAEILAMEHLFGVKNNYFPPDYHPLFKPFAYELDDRWNTYLNYLQWAKRGGERKPIDYIIDFYGRGAGISQYEKGAIMLFMLEYVLGDGFHSNHAGRKRPESELVL